MPVAGGICADPLTQDLLVSTGTGEVLRVDPIAGSWTVVLAGLQTLTTALEQFSRGESRYQILFLEWQDWDGQLSDAEGAMEASFEVFDELLR